GDVGGIEVARVNAVGQRPAALQDVRGIEVVEHLAAVAVAVGTADPGRGFGRGGEVPNGVLPLDFIHGERAGEAAVGPLPVEADFLGTPAFGLDDGLVAAKRAGVRRNAFGGQAVDGEPLAQVVARGKRAGRDADRLLEIVFDAFEPVRDVVRIVDHA